MNTRTNPQAMACTTTLRFDAMSNKLFILAFLLVVTAGCDNATQEQKLIDGEAWPSELCIRGVVYYTFGYGKAPAHKPDGSLYQCEGSTY